MKRKLVIGTVAVVLSIAMVFGIVYNNGVFKSKADELSTNKSTEEQVNEEAYKEFAKEYRIDGVEISITSLDDLYNEFNKYENIDETLRKNILAKASDEVIVQFLLAEQSELFKLSSEVQADDIYSEVSKETINNEELKNVDIDYYEKANDSIRKVTKITNKFGGSMEITTTDEAEKSLTKGGYRHVRTLKNEANCKEYGDRITAFIEYRPAVLGPIAGELNVGTIKIEMNVIQGADANHPSIAKMNITQNAEVYKKVFS